MPLDEPLRIEFPGDQGVAPVEEDCPDHVVGRLAGRMTRRLLFAGLALGPVVIALHYFTNVGDTALFALAAAALIPSRTSDVRRIRFITLSLAS